MSRISSTVSSIMVDTTAGALKGVSAVGSARRPPRADGV
jgi:hypothetical protein